MEAGVNNMHNDNIPDGGENKAELRQLLDFADAFDQAVVQCLCHDDVIADKYMKELKSDEGRTQYVRRLKSIGDYEESIGDDDGGLLGTLVMIDHSAEIFGRVDQTLAQSFAQAAADRGKPETADLFKKYDLPALEELSRQAIKPPSP